MPIGYRMGSLMLKTLGVPKAQDHDYFMFSELGVGHPQTCMMDGLQASTGCTYGKLMIERQNFGKLAATLWTPTKGAARIAVKPEFTDALGNTSFSTIGRRGLSHHRSRSLLTEIINVVLNATDEEMFTLKLLPDLQHKKTPGSFNKAKCEVCGEYVFDRYLRRKDNKFVCIPCSGYAG